MSPRFPLIVILTAAFALGCVNVALTGSIRVPHGWRVAEQLLLYALGYWWFFLDKQRLEFSAGAIQKIGVAFIPVIAIPVYLVRSRGARNGAFAILGFVTFFAIMSASAMFGGAVGRQIAP